MALFPPLVNLSGDVSTFPLPQSKKGNDSQDTELILVDDELFTVVVEHGQKMSPLSKWVSRLWPNGTPEIRQICFRTRIPGVPFTNFRTFPRNFAYRYSMEIPVEFDFHVT